MLFYVFAVTVVGGGIGVVASRNPVASLMFMVVSLASVAGIYVLLEAHFLAAIQVMVYAGAIMVLFLFVIMLLNLGHDYRDDLVRGLYAVCAFVVSGAICGILATRFGGAETSPLYESFPGAEAMDLELAERGAVSLIARPLFQEYVVPFEITGILLLVAVVGAVALAKKRV
ncbi:MAG: NADH-quinone oxidoreductase subunit J [Gammaproteobacteria bacterium]|nr:NADH-quinone oxidoreductase subunit J [Gammaproteobacteria bacterium]